MMKIRLERDSIIKSLKRCLGIIDKKNINSILKNTFFQLKGNKLILTVTNLELTLIEIIDVEVTNIFHEKELDFLISTDLLYEIFKKLPKNSLIELEINNTKNQLIIISNRTRFFLPYIKDGSFNLPKLDSDFLSFKITIDSKIFKMLIEKVKFAASINEAYPYLNGIYIHMILYEKKSFLRAVATDTHRLAYSETSNYESNSNFPPIILSRKTFIELYRLLEDNNNEKINISFSERYIQFYFQKVTLSSCLLNGSFPKYETVIPKDNKILLKMITKDFLISLNRISSILSRDLLWIVKLSIVEKNKLLISAETQNNESSIEEIDIFEYFHDENIVIGINAKYLLEIVESINDEKICLLIKNKDEAILIRGENNMSLTYVLMPIRI